MGRQLIPAEDRPKLSFCSNDYLGLSVHPKVKNAVVQALSEHGWGSTGSRLLSGDRRLFHQLETQLAAWKHKPIALVFNSGYAMNVSLIASVLGPQDAVFADRYCHASIVDGIRLSGSRLFRFAHNDAQHLERLLTQHRHLYKQALIVSESVFSMDGDRAPLADLIALKKRFQTLLMIDEAHALGVFGEKGEGLIGLDLAPDVDWIVGTLGKALGSVGGFVATSPEWKDFWINHARGLIYSTALPPASAAASLAALEVIQEGLLHTQLWQNVGVFRQYTLQFPRKILGDTHIIPIIFDSADKTRACAAFLAQRGLDVPAILSPTVPPNQTRIRINICTFHTVEDIKKLCEALWEV